MRALRIDIPDEIAAAHETEPESAAAQLRHAAAAKLYELGRLSSGAAARLANTPRTQLLAHLGEYGMPALRRSEEELRSELGDAWRERSAQLLSLIIGKFLRDFQRIRARRRTRRRSQLPAIGSIFALRKWRRAGGRLPGFGRRRLGQPKRAGPKPGNCPRRPWRGDRGLDVGALDHFDYDFGQARWNAMKRLPARPAPAVSLSASTRSPP